jgi:hypothetical protein
MVRTVTVSILIVFGVNCLTFLEYYKWLVFILKELSSNVQTASKRPPKVETTPWMIRMTLKFGHFMIETHLLIRINPMDNGSAHGMAFLGAFY